jgi:hypothetical protein
METLPDLVARMTELESMEAKAVQQDAVLSDEFYYEKEITKSLIAGRVDQAAELREAVKQRIAALTEALDRTNTLLSKIELAFESGIKLGGSNRLDGLCWSARLQNNSRAAVIIDDESKITDTYKLWSVDIRDKGPMDARDQQRFWASVILRKPITAKEYETLSPDDRKKVDECLQISVSKTLLEAALKKDPTSVPGARLHKGQHLRISQGESKVKPLPKPKEEKADGSI